MSEHIILVRGAAFPKTQAKAVWEMAYSQQCVATLRKEGHTVTTVGVPWRGFYARHLQEAFQKIPQANLVIVDAHGNIKRGMHYIAARHEKSSNIWARDFYKNLAEFAGHRPLNVFMFSCGSGNGCLAAAKFLPAGSTLVNITKEDEVSSYIAATNYLDLKPTEDRPFAETLFLNLLARGHKEGTAVYPQITVSDFHDPQNNIWSLWDLVRMNTLEHEMCDAAFEAAAKNYLREYFSADKIGEALRTIELYIKALTSTFEGYQASDTPVRIRARIDEESFLRDATNKGLMGVLCALAYYANRDDIGAFQLGTNLPAAQPVRKAKQKKAAILAMP